MNRFKIGDRVTVRGVTREGPGWVWDGPRNGAVIDTRLAHPRVAIEDNGRTCLWYCDERWMEAESGPW